MDPPGGLGAGDDAAAPDSWEAADIDDRVRRLLISSPPRKPAAAQPPPAPAEDKAKVASPALPEDGLRAVDQFLLEALEKPRERLAVLRMEQEIEKFICDPIQQQMELSAIPNSYLRLAAHRLAQHYNLQSVPLLDNCLPDGSGSRILLLKVPYVCHKPLIRLADIPVKLPQDEKDVYVKLAIKQRPQKHMQHAGGAGSQKTNMMRSVEERKEEYNKARARIFSSNSTSSSGTMAKIDDEIKLPDNLNDCSYFGPAPEDVSYARTSEQMHLHGHCDSSDLNRTSRSKSEKEPAPTGYRQNNRVAIFRDRDVDRKDPDYDRSYDRYVRRFDPGFGFTGENYAVQPLYASAMNYNTEFPQLGSGQRTQIPVDQPIQQPLSVPQPMHHISWSAGPLPTAMGYRTPQSTMLPYNPSPTGSHLPTPLYVQSSQYSAPPHHGMPFVNSNELLRSFIQAPQQQPEPSFGLARPR